MPRQSKPALKEPSLDGIRHSLAHLLAAAVLKKFPDTELGIGPIIENGFYYDFKFKKEISADILPELEAMMRDFVKEELPFSGTKVTPAQAKKLFARQPFKLDLIKEFSKDKNPLTVYKTGDIFQDLCRGGHVKSTEEINPRAFKLDRIAGAYWRGDQKNPQLTRIYGLAFASKEDLDAHVAMREQAEKRDHKTLGPQLDLFTFSDLVGPGLPLWTPKGTLLRNLLDDFVWKLRSARGYEKVEIPHITKKDLYEKSGHWDKYKDDLFRVTTREGHEFAMKPMNCPHHTQIYARRPWSYRELPHRYANSTMVYRDEQSGELAGISRVLSITQDDAHVFCRMAQVKEESLKIWDVINEFYGAFGIPLRVRLSLRDPKHPEKYLGDAARWKSAEAVLREIVSERDIETEDGLGEAAFYGPKLDFMGRDAIGRQHQVATIQIDMNMPERFDLTCTNEEGKTERIVMIHAAIMGSIERFLALAIEHFAGAFPVWLSPVQAIVLPVGEKVLGYGTKIFDTLKKQGIRVEMPETNESLGKRIRQAELQKIPYIIVVGEKEETAGTISVRKRGEKESEVLELGAFMENAQKQIETKAM